MKRTTTSTRFSQAVLAREPASFLLEKVIVIFIPIRVLGRVVAETCYQNNVRGFATGRGPNLLQ